jgi:hypothetical protein
MVGAAVNWPPWSSFLQLATTRSHRKYGIVQSATRWSLNWLHQEC